ncbi:hypothetical protein BLNAU_14238 [Blattamonas nauphoetae]|uniref:Uncharacterized protein n=1 Tax=Blattamonas nauphoetae TaxID=2049346 RepID=A0ABQ9XHZ5_9EUKA|nr:hypothetical protein BLNAU_14238 [Blattamonas nauphoetae]
METHLPMTTTASDPDHSAFIDWDGKPIETPSERLTIYVSLIRLMKNKQAFSSSLEAKAESLLDQIKLTTAEEVKDFLKMLLPSALQESSRTFVETVGDLISVPFREISTTTILVVFVDICHLKVDSLFTLVKNGLVSKLITSVDISSLPFRHVDILNSSLIIILHKALLSTFSKFMDTLINQTNDHQSISEIAFSQIVLPSDRYLQYLCENCYSIWDDTLSHYYMELLPQLLCIAPQNQQTTEFVLNRPICLTVTSAMTFFTFDKSFSTPMGTMEMFQMLWPDTDGEMPERWNTVVRALRTEGIDDVAEQRLNNDVGEKNGQKVVKRTISWINKLGMNLIKPE